MLILALMLQEIAVPPTMSAPPIDMTAYYSGTLQIDRNGVKDRMAIDRDHRYITYRVNMPQIPGQWWFNDDKQFCTLPDRLSSAPKTVFCMALPAHKIGDTWTQSFGDAKVVFTLQPGRPRPGLMQKLSRN